MANYTQNILEDVYSISQEEKNFENGGYLGVSKSCLYKLTMGRKIPHYKSQGGKLCYFDRQEIIEWMKAHRVATQEELEAKAMEIAKKGGKG